MPATGASLTASTVTSTSPVANPPLLSVIVYSITATPLKFGFGVKVMLPSALITTVPSGELADTTSSGSKSGSVSLPSTGMVTGVSSGVIAVSSFATGPMLATVQVKVVVTVPPLPSSAVTVTV